MSKINELLKELAEVKEEKAKKIKEKESKIIEDKQIKEKFFNYLLDVGNIAKANNTSYKEVATMGAEYLCRHHQTSDYDVQSVITFQKGTNPEYISGRVTAYSLQISMWKIPIGLNKKPTHPVIEFYARCDTINNFCDYGNKLEDFPEYIDDVELKYNPNGIKESNLSEDDIRNIVFQVLDWLEESLTLQLTNQIKRIKDELKTL